MIDLKPTILEALQNNATLISLLGGERIWAEEPPDETVPYITFYELVNRNVDYADNVAMRSEIHFHMDIWSETPISQLAIETNRTMEELGFVRTSCMDGYDFETKNYRKILRYKTRVGM